IVSQDQGQWAEAADHYQEALRLRCPTHTRAAVHNNLGTVLEKQGELRQALAHYQEAVRLGCIQAESSLLVFMNLDPGVSPAELFAEHRRGGARHAALSAASVPHANDPSPQRRLRIGYVSPDFHYHVVAPITEPILVAHDREDFQVFCYADVARP